MEGYPASQFTLSTPPACQPLRTPAACSSAAQAWWGLGCRGRTYTEQGCRAGLRGPGTPCPEHSGSVRRVRLPGSKALPRFAQFAVSGPGDYRTSPKSLARPLSPLPSGGPALSSTGEKEEPTEALQKRGRYSLRADLSEEWGGGLGQGLKMRNTRQAGPTWRSLPLLAPVERGCRTGGGFPAQAHPLSWKGRCGVGVGGQDLGHTLPHCSVAPPWPDSVSPLG